MFAAVRGSKGALKRSQMETWFATLSGQNRASLKAGYFKGTKMVFGELHDKQQARRLGKCGWFELLSELAGRCIPCHNGIVTVHVVSS